MVASVDESVGRLLAKLDEAGLTDRTIVIFTSDNGGHGPVTSNAPLRGAKGMLYEGGIRVPMAVRWPGRVQPGSRSETPVIGTDLYPTLLALAGADQPSDQPVDGVSLEPLLTGSGRLAPRPLFWHFPAYLEATRDIPGPWRTTPASAVRAGRHKLLEFFEGGRLELYDLAEDLGETHDLASSRPEVAAELHHMLVQWRESIEAFVPVEVNPLYEEPRATSNLPVTDR